MWHRKRGDRAQLKETWFYPHWDTKIFSDEKLLLEDFNLRLKTEKLKGNHEYNLEDYMSEVIVAMIKQKKKIKGEGIVQDLLDSTKLSDQEKNLIVYNLNELSKSEK